MATISYKCDTCKRNIELLENIQGLTVFGKCIITNGCLGKLKSLSRNQNNLRESLPKYDSFDNYESRVIFNEHVQSVNSNTWDVNHNLNCFPSISVFINTDDGDIVELNQDEYTSTIVDSDNIRITFSDKKSGVVHSIARSGSQSKPKLIESPVSLSQITTNSLLTLSVPKYLVDTTSLVLTEIVGPIKIEVEILKPNEEPLECFETFDDELSPLSPWYNWTEIIVRKRRIYKPRSKLISEFRVIKDQSIPDGTVIKFKRIDFGDGVYRNIESKTLLFLLATSPFTTYDKVKNKLNDVGEMLDTKFNYFVYNSGDLFTDATNIENTYPDTQQA